MAWSAVISFLVAPLLFICLCTVSYRFTCAARAGNLPRRTAEWQSLSIWALGINAILAAGANALDSTIHIRTPMMAASMLWFLLEYSWFQPSRRSYWRAALKDQMYLVCPGCHYSLSGLADAGRCPECGRHFVAADLKAEWDELDRTGEVPRARRSGP